MTTAPHVEAPQDRLARARAALDAAEVRTSGRLGGPRDRRGLRALRGGSAASSVRTAPPQEAIESTADATGARLPVPAALASLIPYGSLRAGSSVAVTGPARSSLLLALAAAAVGEEAWCAVAGMPNLGLGSALDAGLDPTRLAIMTGCSVQENPQLPQVLSAVADGVGVLVLGPELSLSPALWRSLTARARTQDTLLLAASPAGRADLTLDTRSAGWSGLGYGSGRLRRRCVEVRSVGRGVHGDQQISILLPEVRGLLADVPGTTRAETRAAAATSGELQMVRRVG